MSCAAVKMDVDKTRDYIAAIGIQNGIFGGGQGKPAFLCKERFFDKAFSIMKDKSVDNFQLITPFLLNRITVTKGYF